MSTGFHYRGRPIEEYTHEQLVQLIINLVKQQELDREEHSRQLGVLTRK